MSPCHIAAKVECGGFVYAQNEREEGEYCSFLRNV